MSSHYATAERDLSSVRSFLAAPNAQELRSWVEEAITLLLSFQQENGYINAYILTVSPTKPFENLRDLHELVGALCLLVSTLC